jgi:diguanylate cyclase (GGDEF)-like protein
MWLRNMPLRGRPERAYAATFLLAELMLSLAIILGHGPQRDYLMIIALPVLFVAVVFPRRVVVAATAVGVGLTVALAFTVARGEVLAVPAVVYAPVFVLLSLVSASLVIRDLEDASRRRAFVDELTGALRRAALPARVAELNHQARSGRLPVAAIVGDIDHFKAVNDEHGHVAGDQVLREVVRRVSDCVGPFDPVYRYGGEEFLILLPGLDGRQAQEVALSMWHAVRDEPIEGIRVTMSFGVAGSLGEGFDFDDVFARADMALYAAKRGGRDWVRMAADAQVATQATSGDPAADGLPAGKVGHREAERRAPVFEGAGIAPPAEAVPAGVAGWTRGSAHVEEGPGSVTADLERRHVLEFSYELRPMFMLIAGGAFLLIASAIPWFGWQPLVGPVIGALIYVPLMNYARHLRRPELMVGFALLVFQGSIAIGFLSAHGAPVFALPLFTLMIPGMSAILRGRLAVLAMVWTGALMVTVALVLASGQVAHAPSVVMFPLALLVEAFYVGWMVGASAVGHRGAEIVDPLTGLLNRRALNARILELDSHAGTLPLEVGVLLIDMDNFKQINDREGHAVGDAVLRDAGERIRNQLRARESAYRVGGEEVLVLIPQADIGAATAVAERLRRAVRDEPCGGRSVTVSIGVCVPRPGERFVYREIFQRADEALYQAKRLGRDRVCAAGMSVLPVEPLAPRGDIDQRVAEEEAPGLSVTAAGGRA